MSILVADYPAKRMPSLSCDYGDLSRDAERLGSAARNSKRSAAVARPLQPKVRPAPHLHLLRAS